MSQLAVFQAARASLARGEPAVVVQLSEVEGSAPREAGTRMLVTDGEVQGTVGGGHLEWVAIHAAREALARSDAAPEFTQRHALGPSLGQCCGGVVHLRYTRLTPAVLARWEAPPLRFFLQLHGAGHVGRAVVHLLEGIDCGVQWIDEREAGFPPGTLPPHIDCRAVDSAVDAVDAAPVGACYLVMTHRHDLDQSIVAAALQRGDARFVGMIGSATKAARTRRRLLERGLPSDRVEQLCCPIGLPGLDGKAPAELAVAIVAQLLMLTSGSSTPPLETAAGRP